jgi:choline kinase
MKIIILSAGKGERLYPLTKNTPKPLLDMGYGKTLLEEQIERIQKSGVIDNIVLVIGYLAEQIEEKIKYYEDKGIKITTVYNPFYDVSNNLISLWFAKGEMNDSFLVTNGDNLFAVDVFVNFIRENTNGIYLSISRKNQFDNDDMKVKLNNELVDFISKNIEPESAHAESPGLLLVEGERSVDLVKDELDKLARKPEHRNSYWLELPNSLVKKGIPIRAWEFDGMAKWQEVDIHLDITRAKKLLGISRSI